MSGYCVKGEHEDCPDSKKDNYICSCPCHLEDKRISQEISHDS